MSGSGLARPPRSAARSQLQKSVPDGVNEQGLYAGLLYLPSFAEYQDEARSPAERLWTAPGLDDTSGCCS